MSCIELLAMWTTHLQHPRMSQRQRIFGTLRKLYIRTWNKRTVYVVGKFYKSRFVNCEGICNPGDHKSKKTTMKARDVIGNRVNVVKGKVYPLNCREDTEGE